MQIQDLDRIFKSQGERQAEVEANSALDGVDRQEQAELAARLAREAKGRSIERRFTRTRGHFRSFMHLTADWTRDVRGRKIVASPLINLGPQISPLWGEGSLSACVTAYADNGWLTGYKTAQRFVTQTCFNGLDDDQPRHEVKTETFGYGPPFMPRLSGNVTLPRKLEWADRYDRVVDDEMACMKLLCAQAADTLGLLIHKAMDPELNPELAVRLQADPVALQRLTSVVKLPSQ